MAAKMGRPTDNPKPYKIAVRLDEESKSILDEYLGSYTVEYGFNYNE